MPDLSTDQPLFIFHQGSAPLLISFPHVGTHLPPALAAGLLINVPADKVIRLLPPLTFSADEAQELVARLSVLIRDFLAS